MPGWTAKTDIWIDFITPAAQLQIQTDSAHGSGAKMWVQLKDIGGVELVFNNPPTYNIEFCNENDITFTMPKADYHIWTITKYPTKLTMYCNGVEIFDYKFSNSDISLCSSKWSPEQTAFRINPVDTASDYFRQVPNYGE